MLFQVNQIALVQTERKLLDECDLWRIVSLPAGAFVNAGAGVKTNLLFFTKGKPTEIEGKGYDLKAVNPFAKKDEDLRTPEELLDIIEAKGREVAALRALSRRDG